MEQVLALSTLPYNGKIGLFPAPAGQSTSLRPSLSFKEVFKEQKEPSLLELTQLLKLFDIRMKRNKKFVKIRY